MIVVDKVAGLLTMGTNRERERTAYYMLTNYVRKGNSKSRERLFIVHRLDRDTSGVLVFARTAEAQSRLRDRWAEVSKTYEAIVHGVPEAESGTVELLLAENRAHNVYVTDDAQKGRSTLSRWRRRASTASRALLEVDLVTGHKHQIRVHLDHLGHPIVGDRRYGPQPTGAPRMALHARDLAFPHPYSGEVLSFSSPVPRVFEGILEDGD